MLRIINSGAATGADNMRQDLELAQRVRAAEQPATLRLYTWDPWCVSLGKHQPLEAVDAAEATRCGFDIVHRPTGGRAVLHADEVTYCVCMPVADSIEARRMYGEIHNLLYLALRTITPGLVFASLDSDLRTHYASSGPMGQVCFTSHARTEILWQGRKVVGSAQRVIDGVLLQHGSILCGSGHERLADLVIATDQQREELRGSIDRSSITLSEIAGRAVGATQVIEALTTHLQEFQLSAPARSGAEC